MVEIKRVTVGGNREEINRVTGEHTPNLIDNVKISDLIFTPELLIKKMFKGSNEEYDIWLMKNKLHPSQINFYDIKQKQELMRKLKTYTMKLLYEAKNDSMFNNKLGNMVVSKWIDTFDTLENHIYDLGDFDKIEFIRISDTFKKRFTTNSPFAFLIIDDVNQQLKVIESHKVLLFLNEKLPMGNKRGTPTGQEAEKLYQNFFTTIGYKGKGELTDGLNHHRTNFKNFNFNLNIEVRLLIKIIYEVLKYDRKKIQIGFLFGVYGKKFYFESDINGTERKQEELEALAIVKDARIVIEKELHKNRQGSISPDKTTLEVKKRIEYSKISKEEFTPPKVKEVTSIDLKKQDNLIIKLKNRESNISLSNSLEAFKKEIFIKQKGYVELAKDKINESLANRNQYIKEFYAFLNKGMSVSEALNKFSERYANNPYIKGIIETTIAGELKLQALKDKGIEDLNYTINDLKDEIQELERNIGIKENEIASLNQSIESIIVEHTKQLEKIEVNIGKLVEDREELIKYNSQQSGMIVQLEKLIEQYEQTLRERDNEISKLKGNLLNIDKKYQIILENDKKLFSKKIENYDYEIEHYVKQIEQLKEENKLALSTTNLLKINNKQLEAQLETLNKKR